MAHFGFFIKSVHNVLYIKMDFFLKVEKLKRAFLKDPVLVEVSHNFQTVANLTQSYLFIPSLRKEAYLVYLLNDLQGKSIMIFCDTCANTQRLAFMLRSLGFNAIPLYGQMPQVCSVFTWMITYCRLA